MYISIYMSVYISIYIYMELPQLVEVIGILSCPFFVARHRFSNAMSYQHSEVARQPPSKPRVDRFVRSGSENTRKPYVESLRNLQGREFWAYQTLLGDSVVLRVPCVGCSDAGRIEDTACLEILVDHNHNEL